MHAIDATKASLGLAVIFQPEAIVVGLKHRTKQGAISELVHHLVALGHIVERDEPSVVESILFRERYGTTALYDGVAFPHCRTALAKQFVGVLGMEPEGVAFDAVNGEPVQSLFLFLAPLERREELYEVLGRITAIGRDKTRRAQLRGCRNAEAAYHFLQELDRS